jgi:tetratricopeptide (TPR) repeat protein
MGILHRDIKPANLLVDGRGNLWVTDFGLAQFQNLPGLTTTGDLVGTLRYMSPEQARTRAGPVDHRTDLYSLGATFYELLTLHPPVPGHERQELLAGLARLEPVPPRRLNPALPADLETILLKALAKDPLERYDTAREMADDLRRFLEDQPIRARRPTLAQRAVKWARRHRRLVAGLVVMLVFAVVSLAVSTALIWREKALKEEAYRAEERQRQEAEAKWQLARQAVDEMYLEAEGLLVHGAQQERLQQYLRKGLKFYEEFARDRSTQPAAQLAASRAYHRVGEIQAKLGRTGEAEKAYRQAIDLLERLEPDTRAKPDYRFALALDYTALFKLYAVTSRLRDGERAIRQALALAGRLAEEFPGSAEYRVHEVECSCSLAELHYVAGRYPEAGQGFRRTRALLNRLPADFPRVAFHALTARVQESLGYWLWFNGQHQDAERAYGRARTSLEQLIARSPNAPGYRIELARVQDKLGHLFMTTGRLPQATEACRQAIAIQEKLAKEFPAVPGHRGDLAGYHNTLATMLRRAGQPGQAEAAFDRAITLLEQLTADFPAAPDHRMQLAVCLSNRARWYSDAGRPREAERTYRRALDLDSRLAQDFPDRPEYRGHLARTYQNLGRLLGATGRPAEGEKQFRRALAAYDRLAADFADLPGKRQGKARSGPEPDGPWPPTDRRPPGPVDPGATGLWDRQEAPSRRAGDFRSEQASCHNELGILLTGAGRFSEAERQYRQAQDLFGKLAAGSPDFPDYRYLWVACSRNVASVMNGAHRLHEKGQILAKAYDVQEKLLADLPEAPLCRGQWAETLADLALCLRDQGKLQDARRLVGQAVKRSLALRSIPPSPEARLEMHSGYYCLGLACVRLGMYPEAARAAAEMGRLSAGRWQGLGEAANLLARCIPLAEKDTTLSAMDRSARTGMYAGQAQALVNEMLQQGKDDPECQIGAAWSLANGPALQLRDAPRALALAKQAVRKSPDRANYWTTLGAAHYRAGDWKAAATALRKALTLEPPGNSYDWYFLAMARWQLGARDEARRFYQLAVRAMGKTQPGNEELRRFRAEAAALMGLAPPARPGRAPPPLAP